MVGGSVVVVSVVGVSVVVVSVVGGSVLVAAPAEEALSVRVVADIDRKLRMASIAESDIAGEAVRLGCGASGVG